MYELQEAPYSEQPFHNNCEYFKRLVPEGLPAEVAVHVVGPVTGPPVPYVELHVHDTPEVNIFINTGEELIYKIQTDDREFTVEAPACIWIPAGVAHAAWVVRGNGIFMCFHLPQKRESR